mgnify:CR=1 FL=1
MQYLPNILRRMMKHSNPDLCFPAEIKKGDSTTTFVSAGIYGRDEITDKETQETSYIYYVDKNKFKEGDALVEPDSGEKFIIGDTEVLEGVFLCQSGICGIPPDRDPG